MADEHPEVIRQQMEETRASLTEKVEALENQVVGTVQSATAAVNETVDNVKQAVQETVESVKEKLDLSEQTRRHPWAMAGGSVAAGFVTGYLLFGPSRAERRRAEPAAFTSMAAAPAAGPAPKPGWLDRLASRFSSELGQIEELAVTALSGLAKDFVTRTLPQWIEHKAHDLKARATEPPPTGPAYHGATGDEPYHARPTSTQTQGGYG